MDNAEWIQAYFIDVQRHDPYGFLTQMTTNGFTDKELYRLNDEMKEYIIAEGAPEPGTDEWWKLVHEFTAAHKI